MKQEKKQEIIEQFKTHDKDTGSPEIQIALLAEEIKDLLKHLKKHSKDIHSKRGLLKMVTERKKLLKYLESKSEKRYKNLIKKLEPKK